MLPTKPEIPVTQSVRRRDFLLKLLAIPAAAAVSIPLLTDDADAQQQDPDSVPKGAKGQKGAKGAKGGRRRKGKGPIQAPKGRRPGGKGKARAGARDKGKDPDSSPDPAQGKQEEK